MPTSSFFERIDQIAGRVTRLAGLAAICGLLGASSSALLRGEPTVTVFFGYELVSYREASITLTLIVTLLFAMIQALAVAEIVGRSLHDLGTRVSTRYLPVVQLILAMPFLVFIVVVVIAVQNILWLPLEGIGK